LAGRCDPPGEEEQEGDDQEVSATRDNVRVEVRDSGAQGMPVPQPLELDREGGFGLFLIDQLADSWGVENEPSLCVWFEVSTS